MKLGRTANDTYAMLFEVYGVEYVR